MNNIIPFNFLGSSVRIIMIDGAPWFVAKDVAEILGYKNTRKAISDHCKNATAVGRSHETLPLDSQTKIIPEPDIYRLIIKSKLPSAEKFESWVMDEVLPSVRKTGSYGKDPIAVLGNPEGLRNLLLTYSEKVIELEKTVEEQAPKVAALDTLSTADGCMCISNAAKNLQKRPKDLFSFLSQNTWIYKRVGCKNWLGYQHRIQQGVLTHKVTAIRLDDGSERILERVLVTAKGLVKLSKIFQESHPS